MGLKTRRCSISFRSLSVVVLARERWSAKVASGVDILGQCATWITHSRNPSRMCKARIRQDVSGSFLHNLLSHAFTTARLSTCNTTCRCRIRLGQPRNGRIKPNISRVELLWPKSVPLQSLAENSRWSGHRKMATKSTPAELNPTEATPRSPDSEMLVFFSPSHWYAAPAASDTKNKQLRGGPILISEIGNPVPTD